MVLLAVFPARNVRLGTTAKKWEKVKSNFSAFFECNKSKFYFTKSNYLLLSGAFCLPDVGCLCKEPFIMSKEQKCVDPNYDDGNNDDDDDDIDIIDPTDPCDMVFSFSIFLY